MSARVRALAVVSAAHAGLHTYTTLLPLLYPFVLADFRVSYVTLGVLLTIAGGAGAMAQFLSAQLPPRIQSRFVLAAGLGVVVLGSMVGSAAMNFTVFAIGRVVAQVGQGPQHVLANTLISRLYDRSSRGRGFAIHFAAGNLGGILVPFLLLPLVAVVGWRGTLALLAVPIGIVIAFLLLGVREPATEGPQAQEPRPARRLRHLAIGSFAPLWNPRIAPIIAAGAIAAGGRGNGIILVFVPLLLRDHFHLSIGEIGLLYTILVIGSVVGPLIIGNTSDRIGRKVLVSSTLILASIATVVMLAGGSAMPILVGAITVMSVAAFGNGAQLQALMADNARSEEEARAGFGMYFLLVHLVGGVWPLVIAVLLETSGFEAAFGLIAASYVVAAAVLLTVPVTTHEAGPPIPARLPLDDPES